jgi:hypothetical protein
VIKKYIFSAVLSASSFGIAKVPIEVYVQDINEHRSEVSAFSLVPLFLERDFPYLKDLDLVRAYLALHDLPKIFDLDVLRRYGYKGSWPIYQILSKYHGKDRSELKPEHQKELASAIDELNRIEDLFKRDFFKQRYVSEVTIQSLKRFEQIVDVTVTGVSRRKELNIKGPPYHGKRWFEAQGDFEAARISEWLENNFESLVKGQMPLVSMKNSKLRTMSCKNVFKVSR